MYIRVSVFMHLYMFLFLCVSFNILNVILYVFATIFLGENATYFFAILVISFVCSIQ